MRLFFPSAYWCPLALALLLPPFLFAQSVAVRSPQEPLHRRFILKSSDGQILASGDELAIVQGNQVHSRLTFHFRDGSLDDEMTSFTQDGVFHLLSDHHIQKGPSFPDPIDTAIDVPSRTVTWHEQKGGRDVVRTEHVGLPGDLANGLLPLLVENDPPLSSEMRLSWLAVDARPMLVTLSVKPGGTDHIDPAGVTERVSEYTIHVEIHGIAGWFAPLANKQPADIHVWVANDPSPSVVRVEGPFYQDAPIWTVEGADALWHRSQLVR